MGEAIPTPVHLLLDTLLVTAVHGIPILVLPDIPGKEPKFLVESRTLRLLLAGPRSVVNKAPQTTGLILVVVLAFAFASPVIFFLPSKTPKFLLECLVGLSLFLACPRFILNGAPLLGRPFLVVHPDQEPRCCYLSHLHSYVIG